MRNGVFLSIRRVGRAAVCLAVLALALSAGPALGGEPAGAAPGGRAALSVPVPLGWSLRGMFKSNLTRTRAIQGAALFMAFGLLILMKKFASSKDEG